MVEGARLVYRGGMSASFGRNRDPGEEGGQEDRQSDEDLDEGFDEEPDSVDTTSPIRGAKTVFGGPGDGDDDQGFDEEPDRVERDDNADREER
jgi:hypothetical protein